MKKKGVQSGTSAKVEQANRRRARPADAAHDKAAGVQGPNVGYWQAVGSTRAAAKRSKRP